MYLCLQAEHSRINKLVHFFWQHTKGFVPPSRHLLLSAYHQDCQKDSSAGKLDSWCQTFYPGFWTLVLGGYSLVWKHHCLLSFLFKDKVSLNCPGCYGTHLMILLPQPSNKLKYGPEFAYLRYSYSPNHYFTGSWISHFKQDMEKKIKSQVFSVFELKNVLCVLGEKLWSLKNMLIRHVDFHGLKKPKTHKWSFIY